MAFVRHRQLKAPKQGRAMSGVLSDIGNFLVSSLTSPLQAIQKNIEATGYLLQGDFSKANEIGKQGLEQIKTGIQSSLEPLVLIDQEIKKIVPEQYRQFAIGPAELAKLSITDPEQGLKEVYETLRFFTAKPVYELSGKLFGYDNAAYFVTFDIKPSDVGIKEGTPEAAEFSAKSYQVGNAAMSVIGTIYPYVGIAWALYTTARTVEEQKKAKELLDASMAQAQAEMEIQREQQRAALAGQQAELAELEAQLAQINAQKQATNAEIELAASGKENITTPGQKSKAALTIGAAGALAAYLLTV